MHHFGDGMFKWHASPRLSDPEKVQLLRQWLSLTGVLVDVEPGNSGEVTYSLQLDPDAKMYGLERLYRTVWGLCELVMGRDHPLTLMSMNGLAWVMEDNREHRQAEEIHRQQLEACKRALGRKHPYTLAVMSNLSRVLNHQGKHEQAKRMLPAARANTSPIRQAKARILGLLHQRLGQVASPAGSTGQ